MQLLKRFGYYFGGFAIGLVLLAFFLNGRKASCKFDYGPDARVLKSINSKQLIYSAEAQDFMKNKSIDTTQINYILYKGDINFSKSESRKKPCGIYFVEGEIEQKETALIIENCKEKAFIKTIKFTN